MPTLPPVANRPTPAATRDLAYRIARDGEDAAGLGSTPEEIAAAKSYLLRVAETDGKLALGKNLVLTERALADALENGDVKNALSALKQQAEVLRLCDFASSDAALQTASDERESIVRGYLESISICRKGLKLEELARQVAQFVADKILPENRPENLSDEIEPEASHETST